MTSHSMVSYKTEQEEMVIHCYLALLSTLLRYTFTLIVLVGSLVNKVAALMKNYSMEKYFGILSSGHYNEVAVK